MRVLLIDSLPEPALLLRLRAAGYTVDDVDEGDYSMVLAKREDYDAVIMQDEMPDMTGLEMIRAMRHAAVNAPVLVIAACDSRVPALVDLYKSGADHVLPAPYHIDELTSRLGAVIRRAQGHTSATITIGALAVDVDAKCVRVNGRAVHLTNREYGLLELLAMRQGQTVSKEAIMANLYGGMDEPEIKIVDVFLCKVRKRLRDAGCPNYLGTNWGRGYFLSETLIDNSGTPTIKLRPRAKFLETGYGAMIIALEEKPHTLHELVAATSHKLAITSVNASVIRAIKEGYVTRARNAPYAITQAGRDKLARERVHADAWAAHDAQKAA